MEVEKIETRLSLFAIKADLRGLVEQRCDALDRLGELQATAETLPYQDRQTIIPEIAAVEEELVALDGLIRQYLTKELEKIDATAHCILDLTARAAVHRAEADRNYMIAKNEEATVARIKELVLIVMDEFGEKRMRGAIRDLLAKGNGGVQALTIAQPDMVPLGFKSHTLKVTHEQANRIYKLALANIGMDDIAEIVIASERNCEADPKPIRAILEDAERKRRAIIQQAEEATEGTDAERGAWVQEQLKALPGVPGCRLEPRGKHLEVK